MRRRISLVYQRGQAFLQSPLAARLFLGYDSILCTGKLLLFMTSGYLFFLFDGILTCCAAIGKLLCLREKRKHDGKVGYCLVGLVIAIVGVLIFCFADEPIRDPRIGKYTLLAAVGMSAGTLLSLIGNVFALLRASRQRMSSMPMQPLIGLSCALVGLTLTRAAILSITNPVELPAMSHATCVLSGTGTLVIGLLIGIQSIRKRKKGNHGN